MINYRRYLMERFGFPVRAELKANYLLRNGGPLRPLHLSESARLAVYRGLMRLQPKLGIRAFSVVIRKDRLAARATPYDPRAVAWEYLIQRLERLTTSEGTCAMIFHDEGEEDLVRTLARKARRAGTAGSAFGSGTLRRPARLLIDDPVSRRSRESYFIQLADLDAYAAFRRVCPPPQRPVNIVPETMWDELGSARLAQVNYLAGGSTGIVVWP